MTLFFLIAIALIAPPFAFWLGFRRGQADMWRRCKHAIEDGIENGRRVRSLYEQMQNSRHRTCRCAESLAQALGEHD